MRKFELLKDLNSGSKKGDIYIQVDGDEKYYHREDWKTRCDAIIVENSPLLFKEIVEKEPFVWTDELVHQYRIWLWTTEIAQLMTEKERMTAFKATKQPSTGSATAKAMVSEEVKTNIYFSTPLNSEWEIVAIHAVKRLSDGEVFSVGDEVNWRSPEHRGEKPFKITSFQINKMVPNHDRMFCNNQNMDIVYLTKTSPTPSQPQNNKEVVEVHVERRIKRPDEDFYKTMILSSCETKDKLPEIKYAIEKILNP